MLKEYIQAAITEAKYKTLDDGSWFAEIPMLPGVWANGKTIEECRSELIEVLEEWLLLKIRDNDPIPPIRNITITLDKIAV